MIGTPTAISGLLVLIVALAQVFIGAIAALLWLTYVLVGALLALWTLSGRRPWFTRSPSVTPGRLFIVLLSTWATALLISAGVLAVFGTITTNGLSTGYSAEVFASTTLSLLPFFAVFTSTSAIQLKRLLQN